MAAPNYNGWGHLPEHRPAEYPPERRPSPRKSDKAARRKAALRRRGFISLVLVPVALMMGSVYLHTVSAGVSERTAALEEDLSLAEAEREALEVRVAELSGSGRIRTLAGERLGMRDAGATDLRVYGSNGEDGNAGVEQREAEGIR
ncbi:MAG: hypothetical protein ACRDSJ_20165 [Rubrobacteraceae bacterium]